MKLLEIDASTEDTCFRCLHDEVPADPRVRPCAAPLIERFNRRSD